MEELKELGKNRLPGAFIKTYEKVMPIEEIGWDDFKVYPLETIKMVQCVELNLHMRM